MSMSRWVCVGLAALAMACATMCAIFSLVGLLPMLWGGVSLMVIGSLVPHVAMGAAIAHID